MHVMNKISDALFNKYLNAKKHSCFDCRIPYYSYSFSAARRNSDGGASVGRVDAWR